MSDGVGIDTDKLRELAEQATPGPWYVERGGELNEPFWLIGDVLRDRYGTNSISSSDEATIAFIAAANPAVVLSLLAELDQARTDQDGIPRQRKGLNPFLPDAPVRKTFTDEGVIEHVRRWAAGEREKEDWRDGDTNTYRYRANLLEAVCVRHEAASAELVRLRGAITEALAEFDRMRWRVGDIYPNLVAALAASVSGHQETTE